MLLESRAEMVLLIVIGSKGKSGGRRKQHCKVTDYFTLHLALIQIRTLFSPALLQTIYQKKKRKCVLHNPEHIERNCNVIVQQLQCSSLFLFLK